MVSIEALLLVYERCLSAQAGSRYHGIPRINAFNDHTVCGWCDLCQSLTSRSCLLYLRFAFACRHTQPRFSCHLQKTHYSPLDSDPTAFSYLPSQPHLQCFPSPLPSLAFIPNPDFLEYTLMSIHSDRISNCSTWKKTKLSSLAIPRLTLLNHLRWNS